MWSPSRLPSLLSRHQTCPSSSSPMPGVFSQHLSGKTKNGARWNQCRVFNIIVTTVKTVSIRQKQRSGEEEFSGMREASRNPGASRNPLLSAFGAQPSGTWCPNQDSCGPRGRVWGPCVSHPIHMGLDPVLRDPVSALHLCVSCPLEIPSIWIEGVALIHLWPFFSSSWDIYLRSGTFEWVAALCSAGWKPLAVSYYNTIVYHRPNL